MGRKLAVLVAWLGLAACGLSVVGSVDDRAASRSDAGGSSSPSGTIDAGGSRDVRATVALDAQSQSDAVVTAPRFCAAQPTSAVFCADFDEPPLAIGWSTAHLKGTILERDSTLGSPSARVKGTPTKDFLYTATLPVGRRPKVRFSSRVYLVSSATTAIVTFASLMLDTGFEMLLRLDNGNITMHDGAKVHATFPVPSTTWIPIAITLTLTDASLRVGDQETTVARSPQATASAGGWLGVGLYYPESSSGAVDFALDDILVTAE